MNKSDKKHIAFVYEGESAEDRLLANLQKNYFEEFSEVEIFNLSTEGNIYMLWKKLVEDKFETNVIDLLKEMNKDIKESLEHKGLKASQFSEIYMFFDYDGHAIQFSDETIEEANQICQSLGMEDIRNKRDLLERMLCVFDNETEQGKLYVSYPMIESIKEIDAESARYKRLYVMLEDVSKYKSCFVEKSCYENYARITRNMWELACVASVRQASLIVKASEKCTYEQFLKEMSQKQIYHAQKDLYINNASGYFLAVLNSVPLFIVEYFGEIPNVKTKEASVIFESSVRKQKRRG